MRIALVLNPRSGGVDDANVLVKQVRARCDHLTVHEIDEPEAAFAEGPDRVLVAGGDGSLGAVFGAAAASPYATPVGVLPAGTANDFARSLDLPLDVKPALELATDPHAGLQKIWAGSANGRPFVNVASAGLAVEAAEYAEDHKKRFGPAAYLVGALHAGVAGSPVRATVEIDGVQQETGRVWQVLVGASGRFGGGSGLGDAEPRERDFTVAWVPARSRYTLPFRALGMRSRTLERQPGIASWQDARPVVVASRGGTPVEWNLDGERWRPETARVEFAPIGPVPVFVPG